MKKPAVLSLALPEGTLRVAVHRRARKTIGISIRDGVVELAAPPHVTEARLNALLEARKDWIARHWREQQARLAQRSQAALPTELMCRGQTLALRHEPGVRREVRRSADGLLVRGVDPQQEPAAWQALLANWLKREAAREFAPLLAHWATHTGLKPSRVGLSSAQRRWGSCSASGAVRLNWRLLMAPPAVLDYVIVHELAHLEHMNHSAAFWSLVARWMPDWRERRQWLKQHGDSLFVFG
jgi:predicted metal-dependent hydrolase